MSRYASGHFSKVSCACFRLCTEYEALHKIETEGNDFINQFMQKWGKKWRQENVFRTHSHSSWWAALFFYSFHFTKYHLLPPQGAFAGMCIIFIFCFAQGTILPFFSCINKKKSFPNLKCVSFRWSWYSVIFESLSAVGPFATIINLWLN